MNTALSVILKAFTGLDPRVRAARVQSELTSAGVRSVWLDIEAEDEDGRISDLETQRVVGKDLPEQALLHLSTIVTSKVHSGDSCNEAPAVWVIFVAETDFAGDGEASHHCQLQTENNELLGAPAHIVVVNGEYKGTGTLAGQVIHDIMARDPQEMLVPEMHVPVLYLKETEEGQKEITEALAQLVDIGESIDEKRGELKAVERFIRNMAADGFPLDQIERLTGATAEDVQRIMDDVAAGPRHNSCKDRSRVLVAVR